MSSTLYGNVISPYVRRVRIVAVELGLSFPMVNTSTEEGQRALRALSPVWKVPAAEIEGEVYLDSYAILERLCEGHGNSEFCMPRDTKSRRLVTVIDAALDAMINAFYLEKEGATPAKVPYVAKQRARTQASLGWLEREWPEASSALGAPFGFLQMSLLTALDWMAFRDVYPIADHPRLVAACEVHRERASVRETAPIAA